MPNIKELTDDMLVADFLKGNNQAFDQLLDRHKNRIFNYILHLVKDQDMADDMFQETFVKAIMTIKQGRYTADGKFLSWIMRIAHNIVIDHFRQEKNDMSVSSDDSQVDLLNRREYSDSTIEDVLIERAISDNVRSLIRSLPREQRQVLVMRYYNDLSFKEIAQRTNVSINTALGRMRYAIINLRRMAKENNIVLTR